MGEEKGNYSFHCNWCGYTYISDNKEAVKRARKTHKIVEKREMMRFKYCPLVPTAKGKPLFARPDLVLNHPELFANV